MGCASSAKPGEYQQPEATPSQVQKSKEEEQFCFKDAEDNSKDAHEQGAQPLSDRPPSPRADTAEQCAYADQQQTQEVSPATAEPYASKSDCNLEPKPILMQKRASALGKRRVKIRRHQKIQQARLTDNDLDEDQESDSGTPLIGTAGETGRKSKLDQVDNMNVSLGDEFDL